MNLVCEGVVGYLECSFGKKSLINELCYLYIDGKLLEVCKLVLVCINIEQYAC